MSSQYEQQALAHPQAHLFDPYHLRPLASLSRRRLIALPGLDEDDVGKLGRELLSDLALIKLIRPHARTLQLEGTPDGDAGLDRMPQQLNAIMSGPDVPRRRLAASIAEAIAARHGRLVGYLIASILLSSHGLTDPLCPWNEGVWRFETVDSLLQVHPVASAEDAADSTLSIQALAALVYGTHDPADFTFHGWGDPLPQMQAMMRGMFPRMLPHLHEIF
ncbi:MAG: sterol carrier protein domain-containing protein [Anaerolineae bacterium]|nr:sterol carrier protein domain-containing protein [Anaerolineae bacterium]